MTNKPLTYTWIERGGTRFEQGENGCETRRNEQTTTYAFGQFDDKRREHGARATTFEINAVPFVYTEAAPWRNHGLSLEVGVYYGAVVGATRSNKRFGAGQVVNYFSTAEDRAAYIAARLTSMKKRTAQ